MDTGRDNLRDHLLAALEAAPELPREDREHLADGFLDELEAKYRLLPRSEGLKERIGVDWQAVESGVRRFWPALAAGFALLIILPTIFWVFGFDSGDGHYGDGYEHHHPFFLVPLLIILAIAWLSRNRIGWNRGRWMKWK